MFFQTGRCVGLIIEFGRISPSLLCWARAVGRRAALFVLLISARASELSRMYFMMEMEFNVQRIANNELYSPQSLRDECT